MDKIVIIKIIFGSLLSLGAFILLLLAYLLFYKYIIQEKRCTAKTKGVVKKYTLGTRGGENSGIHLPVVSYNVDGKEYKVVGPEYKSYVVITKSGPMNENSEVYKEENQVLTINRSANSFVEMRGHIMEHIYPVGTKIDVLHSLGIALFLSPPASEMIPNGTSFAMLFNTLPIRIDALPRSLWISAPE